MVEIRQSFRSMDAWAGFSDRLGNYTAQRFAIVNDVRSRGFVEPITGIRRLPHEISIREDNLHETISSHELNARKRALLAQVQLELDARGLWWRRDLRILGAEALSRVALVLRGRFPYFQGTEYLPKAEDRLSRFPIMHMDLQDIAFPRESFDVFISGDVFEHIPDLDRALREIMRVLKPGGLLISGFPFAPGRVATVTCASIDQDGTIKHHLPPEYHGNPVDPDNGSLVFQYPGWDILEKLRNWGCSDAYYSTIASSILGIVSNAKPGPFVLTAQKAGGAAIRQKGPTPIRLQGSVPDRVVALVALPRSGTTVLTSIFAVHSGVAAVYEPWNAKVLPLPKNGEAQLELLIKNEDIDVAGKILLVKETGAAPEFIRATGRLLETTPFPLEKRTIMLVRDPYHTFLSEVERRNEWWGESVELNDKAAENWQKVRGQVLRHILALFENTDGCLLAFEELTRQPARILEELGCRIGFRVEPQQLEYEKHIDGARVRGDLNVSRAPVALSEERARMRDGKIVELRRLVAASPAAAWFEAFSVLHAFIVSKGGVVSFRELPQAIIDDLLKA